MPSIKFRSPLRLQSGLIVDEIYKANGASDLSTCQFRFVTLGTVSGEIVGATGASNPYPLGILQNSPAASGAAVVRLFGRSSLVVPATPCTLRVGDFISSTGCGGGFYAGPSGMVFGRVMSGSVASGTGTDTITVFVNTITPSASLQSAS